MMFILICEQIWDVIFDMEMDFSDLLTEEQPKKPKYQTIALTQNDFALIAEARDKYGKKKAAEIMRRGIRVAINTALGKSS